MTFFQNLQTKITNNKYTYSTFVEKVLIIYGVVPKSISLTNLSSSSGSKANDDEGSTPKFFALLLHPKVSFDLSRSTLNFHPMENSISPFGLALIFYEGGGSYIVLLHAHKTSIMLT